MASQSANIVFARPVYLSKDRCTSEKVASTVNPKSCLKRHANKQIQFTDVTTFTFSDNGNPSPPPRPSPPCPSCVTKQSEYTIPHKNRPKGESTSINGDLQMPKPLTLTNASDHDEIWHKAVSTGMGIISNNYTLMNPPTMMEMLHNYSPVDADFMSDHSDSSTDTMIMMTTEEERKNQEKINNSLNEYTSIKTKLERKITNKSKASIQNKKNMHIQFSDTVCLNTSWAQVPSDSSNEPLYSKVVPLHVRTENRNGSCLSSSESQTIKTNSNQGSPNDSPDDGYGTNSSSGTISSPFSSSHGSSDFEHLSYNGHSKRIILPNGAIKPNSVRESWAVKRKQRIIEAQDNTIQEQLRELAIIDEEGLGNVNRNTNIYQDKNFHGFNVADRSGNNSKPGVNIVLSNTHFNKSNVHSQGDSVVPFINVSPNDLQRINRQLYVVDSERDDNIDNLEENGSALRANQHVVYTNAHDNRLQANQHVNYRNAQLLPTKEINGNRCLPHQKICNGSVQTMQQTENMIEESTRAERNLRADGSTRTERASWNNDSEISGQNSANCGHILPQDGTEQHLRTSSGSGKIYLSPSGDEGFYSLNRSSRSTSASSFQPINELTEFRHGLLVTNNTPRSSLEVLSDDLFEKWSDMDRNYRNYYGFEEQGEKYSRTDSKVNYFQEKKISSTYGQDNYYRPQVDGLDTQGNSQISGQELTIQEIIREKTNGHTPNHQKTSSNDHVKSQNYLEKDGPGSKSKLLQILPNMFKPSGKKQNPDIKCNKGTTSTKKADPVITEVRHEVKCDSEPEAEYINVGDLPQYSLANIEYEEKLKKGQHVSLETLQRRPVFASSRDIKKLFSTHDQSFDSINNPGAQRHSFHAMPLSYRYNVSTNSDTSNTRQRSQSICDSNTRGQELSNSVVNRMAMISHKNAVVMSRARQVLNKEEELAGSTTSGTGIVNNVQATFKQRLDSDSSCGDSKLSTLV